MIRTQRLATACKIAAFESWVNLMKGVSVAVSLSLICRMPEGEGLHLLTPPRRHTKPMHTCCMPLVKAWT